MGAGDFSQITSATALPSPPMMECSSTVKSFPVSFAAFTMISSSMGLMVWILITLALIPSASSSFAASRLSLTGRPVARMVMSLPSRSSTPFPGTKLYSGVSLITGTARRPNLIYTGPSMAYAAFTAAFASMSSEGLKIVIPGMVRIRAISSLH